MGKLELTEVSPDSPLWDEFLELSCSYLLNLWPELAPDNNALTFRREYEAKLEKRIAEGGRGLFLLREANSIIGLTNAFLTRDQERITWLNIAEFHIKEKRQNKGYGGRMFNLLLHWGRQNGAQFVGAEVDPDLPGANGFWSHLMGQCKAPNQRNFYHASLASYRIS